MKSIGVKHKGFLTRVRLQSSSLGLNWVCMISGIPRVASSKVMILPRLNTYCFEISQESKKSASLK